MTIIKLMLLSIKFKELFMINLNDSTIYNSFADHPLASTYFKYIEILISKNLNQEAQHLLDIAHVPLTDEISNEIAEIMGGIYRMIDQNTDYTNEFIELGKQINTTH